MMTIRSEGLFWQAVGAMGVFGGAFLLVHTITRYGLTSVEPHAILLGLASSFLMMAGALGYLTGRGLNAQQSGMKRLESILWRVFAGVAIFGGIATVVGTKLNLHILLLDRLVMGFAGAFAIMLGLICLLGQRLMAHMHALGTQAAPEVKAQAAEAGQP